MGAISAAQILISWSHRSLVRHPRLNRGGNRQLNRAPHTIVLTRSRSDPATRFYITRRLAEGKTLRETKRCLKRIRSATVPDSPTPTPPGAPEPLDAT